MTKCPICGDSVPDVDAHLNACLPKPRQTETLQQYLIREYEQGKIEFVLRIASVYNGKVEIYIHPLGRDGTTTPTFIVNGDTVERRPGDRLVTEG